VQAGTPDVGQAVAEAKVVIEGVLRVQVQRYHWPPQALHTAAQRRGQGAAADAAVDRTQSHHIRADTRGFAPLLVGTVGMWRKRRTTAHVGAGVVVDLDVFEELQHRIHSLDITGSCLIKQLKKIIGSAHSQHSFTTHLKDVKGQLY